MKREPQSDEAEIVAACRAGERSGQRALYERFHRQVYRVLLAQAADPELAEDLVQETFLKAFRAIDGFQGRSSVRSWLVRIALNCFYELRRREATRRRLLAEALPEGQESTRLRAQWTGRAARGTEEAAGRRRLLLLALREVTSRDREILVLHEVEGYRYREIAEVLDIAPGTVGSRLHRARTRLRRAIERLEGDAEETGPADHPNDEKNHETAPDREPAGVPVERLRGER